MYWLMALLFMFMINPIFPLEKGANLTRENVADVRYLFENKNNVFEKLTYKKLKICHNNDQANSSNGGQSESLLEVKGFIRNQSKSWGDYPQYFETKDDYEFFGSERNYFDASIEDKKIKGTLSIEYNGQGSGRKRQISEESILVTFTLGSIQARLVSTDNDRARFQYAGGVFEVILGEKECVVKSKINNKNRVYFKEKDEKDSEGNNSANDRPAKVMSR